MKLNGLSTEQLIALRKKIEEDPKSKSSGGLFLYTKAARAKFDKIDRAIASNVREARLARGETVDDSGYSGRNSNK